MQDRPTAAGERNGDAATLMASAVTLRACWCGHGVLSEFSTGYDACGHCGTLVSRHGLRPEETDVRDDEHDFYGKTYWLTRQRDELGFPDIYERARLDLPERCLRWLRTVLTYALPPARSLELGSGHGAFVALMRTAGFEATGLELSPWVVDFARKTFGVPVLLGPIETQALPARSLDIVVLNDVLEHLADPVNTLRRCVDLLGPDGFVHVQTPCYPDGASYQELRDANHPFLAMLEEREHLYLFSRRAVQRFFAEIGLAAVRFEPALFPYDMVVLASRRELTPTEPERRDEILFASPAGRVVKAMLDLDDRVREIGADRSERITMIERLNQHIQETSRDDEARQRVILDQQAIVEDVNRRLTDLSRDYEARGRAIRDQQVTIDELNRRLAELSLDYEARGRVIHERQAAIDRIESDRQERLAMIERLNAHIAQTSADYEVRGQLIHDQQGTIDRLERDRQASLATIQRLQGELQALDRDAADRDRMIGKQQDAIEGLRREIAHLTVESEAQLRVIADHQATIDKLIQQ